ncbi:MAG: type transport system permease protein [bacterium]
MRWLLLKDLQILRRSPLLVALLFGYAGLVGGIVGVAVSRPPQKPKVAFLNLVPPSANSVQLGNERIDASKYASRLFDSVTPIRVRSRAEAIAKVRNGDAQAALIIPADITEKLQSAVNLTGAPATPSVEVLYSAENPLQTQAVESRIKSSVSDANRALSNKLTQIAAGYLNILLRGGKFSILGRDFDVLGLQNSKRIIDATLTTRPRGSPDRAALERVSRFAGLAIENLDLSSTVLKSIAAPLQVKRVVVAGKRTSLDAFGVALAATVSLMFAGVLLAAGMLALEREENAFTRLVRGLVSRSGLLAEKVLLAGSAAAVVTLALLGVIAAFRGLDGGRLALWLVALAGGGLAFAAMGVAIGALARDVRAASLLAFMVTLPIAALALVPPGSVSHGLYDGVRAISAVFPFRATLQAVDGALNDTDPGVWEALAHLAALVAGYGVLARVALRRFG